MLKENLICYNGDEIPAGYMPAKYEFKMHSDGSISDEKYTCIPLTPENVEMICDFYLPEVNKRLKEKHGIVLVKRSEEEGLKAEVVK